MRPGRALSFCADRYASPFSSGCLMSGFRAAVSPSARRLVPGAGTAGAGGPLASITVQKERSEKNRRYSNRSAAELRLKPNLARKSYP
jgi:hypothetical protein